MERIYRCEECGQEFASAKECRAHEKMHKDPDNGLWRVPLTTPAPLTTPGYPVNPCEGPWGPATCKAGEGPVGPLGNGATPELDVSAKPGRKYHTSICEGCVNKDKYPGCINVSWDARSGGHCRNYRGEKDI